MKTIKIIFILSLFSSIISCSDYVDVNDRINDIAENSATPDQILPSAMRRGYGIQSTTMNQLGNVFMNAWSPNVFSFTGGYSRETNLIIDNTFYENIYGQTFVTVTNLQFIIDTPNQDHKFDNYIAAAKILKAHHMHYMVDLYGDIPYKEAYKRLANLTPKYNDDQLVYRDLLKGLDEARALITAADANAEPMGSSDIMLGGIMIDWEKFANTIELKMLLRMSNSTGAVATYRDARLALLPQNFITNDVTINPGFSTGNNQQLNPSFFNFIADASGNTVANATFVTCSGHLYRSLTAYTNYPTLSPGTQIIPSSPINYPNLADPRRGRLFRNGAGQPTLRAVTQGSTSVDVFAPLQTDGLPSRWGLGVFNGYFQNPAIVGTGSLYSEGGKNNGYVMTKSESFFLQAEASLRGYPGFTGTQASFDNGITASMQFLNATPGTYIADVNAIPNFGFTASTTFNEQLHAIMYQKWIALLSINGLESFIDYNRTGFPLTPLSISTTQIRKPRRLIYPSSEYISNSNNVPSITPTEIFAATHPSHPFWMLGDPILGN